MCENNISTIILEYYSRVTALKHHIEISMIFQENVLVFPGNYEVYYFEDFYH